MNGFAYCKVPVAPVRADHADQSEIVTQLLFGEPVEIIGEYEQWRQIRTWFDQYEGWVDNKQLLRLREKELKRWLDGISVERSLTRKITAGNGDMIITRGAFVPSEMAAEFSIGSNLYGIDEVAEPDFHSVAEYAQSYLNAPYLWGGKTPFGIDCSGLTQMVFRAFDINLPRDASQQVHSGADVDFSDRQAGDLAFFINAKGNIHHVGILLDAGRIIHASGYVRIDSFAEEGIFRQPENELSHRLHCIKRM